MYVKAFRVTNFRRLNDVLVDLDSDTSIFVGANNSGKTSATHVFQGFFGSTRGNFQIYDFSAGCWSRFDEFDPSTGDADADLPRLTLDIWFEVDDANVHRVVDLLPSLEWDGAPVGVRLEYAPRDGRLLWERYEEAHKAAAAPVRGQSSNLRPWPQNLTEYLSRRLKNEYDIRYSVLDFSRCDKDLRPEPGYVPLSLGTAESGAAKLLDSLIRIDFLNAQRYLSDQDAGRGRDEELSKRLGRFYLRNLDQRDDDVAAMSAVADSEARLNEHFAEVFRPTLARLAQLGYPGFSNPDLVVKAALDAGSILNGSARVFYAVPDADGNSGVTLPDQYNGLGFKNLIYMVVEILDFHHAWIDGTGERPPVHLVMIEEPEAHLHAQLQQVFIRKIREVLPQTPEEFTTQLVVTTHSAHVIYERSFEHIRYFKRGTESEDRQRSDVRNLSVFYDEEEEATRDFLLQYLKLTHCDLFFADGAVLVEGNVERLLLPLIIQKAAPELRASHLTILEVGGAFANKFEKLVDFLGLPTLVITDLDSVEPKAADDAAEDDDSPVLAKGAACMTTQADAVTSNPTLRDWIPRKTTISELLEADEEDKCPARRTGARGLVRVAYQTSQDTDWRGSSDRLAGRTFEEAFALENLVWSQAPERASLGLRIRNANEMGLADLHVAIYERVRNFDKTRFALGLIAADSTWSAPEYIVDGLRWLSSVLLPIEEADVPVGGDEPSDAQPAVEVPVTE